MLFFLFLILGHSKYVISIYFCMLIISLSELTCIRGFHFIMWCQVGSPHVIVCFPCITVMPETGWHYVYVISECVREKINLWHNCHFSIQLELVWMLMTAMAGLTYQVRLVYFITNIQYILTFNGWLMMFKLQILFLFPFWSQLVETLQWKETFLGPLEVQQWAPQTARRPPRVAPSAVSEKMNVWMWNPKILISPQVTSFLASNIY